VLSEQHSQERRQLAFRACRRLVVPAHLSRASIPLFDYTQGSQKRFDSTDHTLVTTRSFLKTLLVAVAATVASALTWGVGRFVLFTSGVRRRRELSNEILVRLQAENPLHLPEAGVWLLRRTGRSEILALDDRCTHLGCRYAWSSKTSRFECPCHGSAFDVNGNVIHGPAAKPLERLSVHQKPGESARLVGGSQ
jgi:nitrite reductase/ring-hydroxylating ferredoxin subunit